MPTFAVTLERFGEWDFGRGLREQDGWDEHAAFMDGLAEEGFILLGGPYESGTHVLHVVDAPDAAIVEGRLAQDPWFGRLLRIERIERWEVLLGVERLAALRRPR